MAQRQTGGRAKAGIFLFISLIAGLVAVFVVYRIIDSLNAQLAEAEKPDPTIKVVAAKRTLYQGQTLAVEPDLVLIDVAPDYVPETVFHSLDEVAGRVPAERIIEGEFIRRERLADPEAGVGLNAIIPKGQRALSINISDGSAVSGFLNPGNYVDVIVTIKGTNQGADLKTVTLLQARKVLAVNARLGEADPDGDTGRDGRQHAPSITLALTPEETEKLAHAYTEGAVTMTLRNDIDVTEHKSNPVAIGKILGKDESKIVRYTEPKNRVVPKRREKPVMTACEVQIVRGGSDTTEKCAPGTP